MTDEPLTIDPTTWPAEMASLTIKETTFALYRSKGLSLSESTLAAGYSASSTDAARHTGHKIAGRPHVRRALAALSQLTARKETLRYGV